MKLCLICAVLFIFGGLIAPDTLVIAGSVGSIGQTKPVYDSYKGVAIGMAAADVRLKLGKPADESDAEDDFTFSDSESVRVFYDENKTVRAISIMYTGDLKLAPVPKAIVGTDIAAKPDGGMHKTVQYPKVGFWISYVRTGGDDAIVIVTLQKMAKES